MSNCSENLESVIRCRLLRAVAVECALIADEIAELGASISAEKVTNDAAITTLQSFDCISQNARSQAKIVEGLARPESSVQHLMCLIEEIPLPAVRHRFRLAAGSGTVPPIAEHHETVLWIENP